MDSIEIKDIVKHFVGQANMTNAPMIFKKWLGTYNCAILFGQIIYWTERTNDPDGWFYKSYKQWEDEIYLTEREAKTAADHLVQLGLIETKIAKVAGNPTKHYRLKAADFSRLFTQFLREEKIAQTIENKALEGNRQNVGNETDKMSVTYTSQKLLTETTQIGACEKNAAPNAIPVSEIEPAQTTEYAAAAYRTLEEKRMDSPLSLPEWSAVIAYAEKLNPDPTHFGKCIEHVRAWAKGRVTPKMISDNFGKYLDEAEKQSPTAIAYEVIEPNRNDSWKNAVSAKDAESFFETASGGEI